MEPFVPKTFSLPHFSGSFLRLWEMCSEANRKSFSIGLAWHIKHNKLCQASTRGQLLGKEKVTSSAIQRQNLEYIPAATRTQTDLNLLSDSMIRLTFPDFTWKLEQQNHSTSRVHSFQSSYFLRCGKKKKKNQCDCNSWHLHSCNQKANRTENQTHTWQLTSATSTRARLHTTQHLKAVSVETGLLPLMRQQKKVF